MLVVVTFVAEGSVPEPILFTGILASAIFAPSMFALELMSSLTIVPLTMLAEAT